MKRSNANSRIFRKIIGLVVAAFLVTACHSPKNSATGASKASERATHENVRATSETITDSTAEPMASLRNTYWKLSEMNGKKVETPDNAKEVHIKFTTQDNRFQGFAGCNGLGGNYMLLGENRIQIKTVATRMYCDRMEVENFLTNALTKTNTYLVKGEKLFLFEGETMLASFESVYF